MPHATYKSGLTVFPVWPTCKSWLHQPASTAAREAPIAAPNESAKFSTAVQSASIPRPPETTMLASVNSGRAPFCFGFTFFMVTNG